MYVIMMELIYLKRSIFVQALKSLMSIDVYIYITNTYNSRCIIFGPKLLTELRLYKNAMKTYFPALFLSEQKLFAYFLVEQKGAFLYSVTKY